MTDRTASPPARRRSTRCGHGPDGVLRSDDLALCGFNPLADPERLAFPLRRSQGVVEGASLGALTLRWHDGSAELGARGCGPDGSALAERVVAAVARWDVDRAALPAVALHPAGAPDDRLSAGPVVEKVHRRLVATYASRSSNSPA